LIAANAAYVSEGEVLFDVPAYEAQGGQYGALSGRSLDDMIAGARVEVAENKRNAADFVLWKPSKPGEPEWDGPRGLKGRPGWHIECSAMSEAVLGLPIDIHGGGHDLIFPHHTNEIAQSCAAHGVADPLAYARYWMHNAFLDFSGEKMSKSVGNVVLVHELVKQYPGEVIRWALLSAHYRSPLDWTPDLLEQSRKNLDRLYGTLRDAQRTIKQYPWDERTSSVKNPIKPSLDRMIDILCDDLNTPQAIADLFMLQDLLRGQMSAKPENERGRHAKTYSDLLVGAGALLGVLQQDPEAWFKSGADDALTSRVEALIVERAAARAAKNWPEADRIRDALNALNVEVMDGPTGATWKMKGAA